jgi:YihY family inner membrane protein
VKVIDRALDGVDRFQRAHRWVAFPFAVFKKFGDDQAGNLAALLAYYGFFSFFPLLLVLVTVLGMVLHGNPHLQQSILHSTLSRLPVIGDQIEQQGVRSLSGSGTALGVGIAATLWAGLGGIKAFENAMNSIWNVPMKKRPNFLKSTTRGLYMLGALGFGIVAAGLLSGVGGGADASWWPTKILGLALAFALNLAVFAFAFKVLTVENVSWRDVMPGAILAAVAWVALQSVGGYYVNHQLKNASQVYGTFATVIGLLTFFYLGAQLTLLAAEVNVVRARKLWPRSLRALTPEEERALVAQAKEEERRAEETVEARFDGGGQRSA